MRIGFLSPQRHLLSALGFPHLCSSLVSLKSQFSLGLQAGKEPQPHTTPQMLIPCLTLSIRAQAPEWPEQFGEETEAGRAAETSTAHPTSEAAAHEFGQCHHSWHGRFLVAVPELTASLSLWWSHRRNEKPALVAPNPPSTPHNGPGSSQAPLMKQTLLTDLWLWGSQHLLWLLPDGFAVLLELIEPLLSPGAWLHF